MKSRISIEVDFDNDNQPVIQILQADSDDVRDKLLSHFTQQFNGSSWCRIRWADPDTSPQGFNRIFITPVKESEFKEEAQIMMEQDRVNQDFKAKFMETGEAHFRKKP